MAEEKLNPAPKPVQLLISVVDRGKGQTVVSLFEEQQVSYHLICLGHGTANSDILDYLGLGETEKDVVFSTVPEEKAAALLHLLSDHMNFNHPGHGIAFTVPVNSVGGQMTLAILSGVLGKGEGIS